MNNYTISREFWFSAAHRIEGHPKCGRLHGHNYKVVVSISGPLDGRGMVMDFGFVDAALKPVIDEMDHRYLVSQDNIHKEDEYARIALEVGDAYVLTTEHSTAEEMAQSLHSKVCQSLHVTPNKVKVLVQETPRNEAVYEG